MTPAELKAALATLLTDLLGQYTERPQGSGTPVDRGPAIYTGEPPASYQATGLEARVSGDPDFDNTPLQGHGESNLAETHIVRLVAHAPGPTKLSAAVRRVVRRYGDASVATIPANETLGISAQVVIRIPR